MGFQIQMSEGHPLWDMSSMLKGCNPVAEWELVLATAPTDGLHRLARAFSEWRVCRGDYRDGEYGCLMFHLLGVASKQELVCREYANEATWWAARRVVRFFDGGMLSFAVARRCVDEEIQRRQARPKSAYSVSDVEASLALSLAPV